MCPCQTPYGPTTLTYSSFFAENQQKLKLQHKIIEGKGFLVSFYIDLSYSLEPKGSSSHVSSMEPRAITAPPPQPLSQQGSKFQHRDKMTIQLMQLQNSYGPVSLSVLYCKLKLWSFQLTGIWWLLVGYNGSLEDDVDITFQGANF